MFLSDSSYNDVRTLYFFLDILGTAVGKGYGTVAGATVPGKEDTHGAAYNVASPYHHGMHAGRINAVMIQHQHNAVWRRRDEARQITLHASQVNGVEAIHILAVVDRFGDPFGIDMFGQRKLYDQAVYALVFIEFLNFGEELCFGYGGVEMNICRFKTDQLTVAHLTGHIGFTGPVVAYQYGHQMRPAARFGQKCSCFLLDIFLDL